MGFLEDSEGIIDQVKERHHLEITACAPQFFSKGKVVQFWHIPEFGEPTQHGEATITHITPNGEILFEDGLPEAVVAGDYMLAKA